MALGSVMPAKKTILTAALALAVLMFLAAAWYVVMRLREPLRSPEDAIPPETAWYIEFRNAEAFLKKAGPDHALSGALMQGGIAGSWWEDASETDSLLRIHSEMAEVYSGCALWVCCIYNEKGEASYLYLMNLPGAHYETEIREFILESYGERIRLEERNEDGVVLTGVKTGDGKVLTYALREGVWMASYDASLTRRSYRVMEEGNALQNDKDFRKIAGTTGKNVDANLYLNLPVVSGQLDSLLAQEHQDFADFMGSVAQWGAFDLSLGEHELNLSGYFACAEEDYLSLLRNSEPQKNSLPSVLPFNTAVMIFIGNDDFKMYSEHYRTFSRGSGARSPDPTLVLREKFGTTPEECFFSWMGKEAALVVTRMPGQNLKPETYAVFRMANRIKAADALASISSPDDDADADTGVLKIRKIDLPGLLPALFGKVFSGLTENYFLLYDDYVIMGNSPLALRNFAASAMSGKTLKQNENYISFTDNVSELSSLCIYVNVRKSLELMEDYLSAGFRRSVEPQLAALRNFQACAIQFSPEGERIYTNIYLRHNPSYRDENPAIWEAVADTGLVAGPLFISDSKEGKRGFVVADLNGRVYFFDLIGRRNWTFDAGGPLMGNPLLLETQGGKTKLVVFNTRKKIFALTPRGKLFRGFPLELKTPASSPVWSWVPGDGTDPRIYWVGDDHVFHACQAGGQSLPGWKSPRIGAAVSRVPSYVRMGSQDFLIVTDGNGMCHYYDRRGQPAFSPNTTEFVHAANSGFFYYPDGKNSRIITTDHRGRIVRVNASGDWETISLKERSPGHAFLYDDFDANGLKDYIFADSGIISVYDVNLKQMFELELPFTTIGTLHRFTIDSPYPCYGIAGADSACIIVVSKKGMAPVSRQLKGSARFVQGAFEVNGAPSLAAVWEHRLYFYYLVELTSD